MDNRADFSQSELGQVSIIVPEIGSVEIGGRTYKTTKIGNQTWLAENLDYKFDVNGSQIPIGVNGTPSTPAAWYYSNDEAQYGIDGTKKCGLLYNWYAVDYLEQNKSTLLPNGWHVASNSNWNTLINTLIESVAGTIIKAKNNSITSYWPSWNGVDSYKFNAVPTGNRTTSFNDVGNSSHFWSSNSYSSSNGYCYYITTINDLINQSIYNSKVNGFPIRLVKDT